MHYPLGLSGRTRRVEDVSEVVFVDFDNDAKYGKAVEILGVAKRSGADVLGIVKRKEEKNKMPEKISDVP